MRKENIVDPLNFLRVIATFLVFFLHTSIFSSQRGFAFGSHTWFLKTPAWGRMDFLHNIRLFYWKRILYKTL